MTGEEESKLEKQIKKLVIINTVSSVIALCCAVAGFVLNLLLRVTSMTVNDGLVYFIILCVIAVLAIIAMLTTCIKLKKIKNMLPPEEETTKDDDGTK